MELIFSTKSSILHSSDGSNVFSFTIIPGVFFSCSAHFILFMDHVTICLNVTW